MSIRNLNFLFTPRSVAVIGASGDSTSVGHRVLSNVLDAGFAGPIYPVNPHWSAIDGMRAFPSVEALPEAPDLAVIVTPPDTVASVVSAAAARGCKAGVIITAGFGEGGAAAGLARRTALLAAARPHLFRIVGPNCLGIMAPHVRLNASFARSRARPGNIALVAQSGAVAAALVDWATPRGVGFSHVVTLGDMIDVDFGDMLDYLAADPATGAILLYVEGITQARKFMSAARAAARLKPVLAVKAGRFAASAHVTASHTGALAGSDAVYEAVFARAGIMRVDDLDDLLAVASLLASGAAVAGDRLAIVTNGGGVGALAADRLISSGGRLARLAPETLAGLNAALPATWSHGNPVDLVGDAGPGKYVAAMDLIAADPGVDGLLVMHCPTAAANPTSIASAVADHAAGQKALLTSWLGEASVGTARNILQAQHIPSFPTPAAAVNAFMDLARYRRLQTLLNEAPEEGGEIPAAAVTAAAAIVAAADGWLPPLQTRQLLRLYGIPSGGAAEAASPEEAADAAARLGTGAGARVALKIRSRDIVHKSDVGGVELDLPPAAVQSAATAMLARVKAAVPAAAVDGFTVEEMIHRPHARELLLGMVRDPTFGPAIAVGHGGTAVEKLNDKCFGFPPLNTTLALDMIGRTRVGGLLEAYRNIPAADHAAITRAMIALGQLVSDHPQIAELDINPLLADEHGVIALDARIRLDRTAPSALMIEPYPRSLAGTLDLKDGTRLTVRPVKPQDAPLIRDFIGALTPEGRRFRFFSARNIDSVSAARLAQIDYDRALALVVGSEDGGVAGFAAFHADPDRAAAEFALAVRPDREGRGLGRALLQRLIAIAGTRGIGRLTGVAMKTNARMLALCRSLGMALADGGDEITVSLDLVSRG